MGRCGGRRLQKEVFKEMTTYYLDTNVLLRFLLKDNLAQAEKAKNYFEKALTGKLRLVVLTEILLEVEYVLRKVYRHSRSALVEDLMTIVDNPSLDIRNRHILRSSLDLYKEFSIDIVDAILFHSAQSNKAHVLSFDKDFQKLTKLKS